MPRVLGAKRQAYYQSQVSTGKCRSLSALVPLSLKNQYNKEHRGSSMRAKCPNAIVMALSIIFFFFLLGAAWN